MALLQLDFKNERDRTLFLPAQPVRSSTDFAWKSLYFEHRTGGDFETEEHEMSGHYLMVKLNPFSKAERKVDGRTQIENQRRGTLVYIPDGCPHRVRYLTKLGGLHLMSLSKDILAEVAGELGVSNFSGVPSLGENEDRFVLEIAESLNREVEAGNPHGTLFAETYARVLATHIITRYRVVEVTNKKLPNLNQKQIRWLDQYIEAMLPHSISLPELAKQVGLSQYYFCRVFKDATGLPPYQYVLHKRLEFVCECLKKDTMSIQDIAFSAGFGDPIQMAKQFKQAHGVSPSQYRAALRSSMR
ncbi:helix-turn-helix domain-containing protein [Solimicrobium silvestre]|uniref:Helix-turn-helix domain n=1 Tax=Solimicrobium silvestre TaxID=2099400 RepID=A0A2S9GYK6_9BURK|nr:AraC family transcriptional regulator [Solimicrobium silvestre]PRC92788.1 Helix-turn-helix domain [Solimicrobium silvestre]